MDLEHAGVPGAIAAVVLDGPGPTLVDPGPASTYPRLVEGLRTLGLSPGDLAHVLLSHIHLD
ncbi:MAG: MBL fold metallo-hydrolase, partial [Gemmatimonadetes bacterium]|nr:MBL fold metallo-hydrolase [Gemmatimonadota bacterium]